MADFKRRQFEVGLEFMRRSSAERNKFSDGSSEPTKYARVIRVLAAPRVFELELLVFILVTITITEIMDYCSYYAK